MELKSTEIFPTDREAPASSVAPMVATAILPTTKRIARQTTPHAPGFIGLALRSAQSSADALDAQCNGITAAEAECREAGGLVAILKGVEKSGENAGAARSDRVAECDGAAVDV